MLQTVEGGRYWCALVIRLEDEVDDALLAAVGDATGLSFEQYGTGGFGGETLAEVWKAGDNLLMEVLCDEVGVKAVLVRADTAEHAIAIRSAVGDHMSAWSEQMLRAQLVDSFAESPQALVALLMATGGARPDDETLDLLQRALDHENEEVRHFAEYAGLVAGELGHPPVVMHDDASERELEEILRPARPVEGDQEWVTVRAGEPGRTVPRPVTWLKTSLDDLDDVLWWVGDQFWVMMISRDHIDRTWQEDIHLSPGYDTALHVVRHEALGSVHLALHGKDVEATVAQLTEEFGAEVLPEAPAALASTASGEARAE
ncbi:hypothetical protein [Actinomadura oligospora]|uniref:hypothetical protein n=1 Tax=Actinomadura oligospora TaxID=111804 RepID=UPI00047C334A|nr:hypothetical protein [Actinomadura oligospora]